jgi:glycosyltransferase involved in cell wall biosynthesis
VVWFPSLLGYVPVLQRVPIVVGIHDTIGHRFPRETFGTTAAAVAWRVKTRLALSQAARVVTVSAHARDRLQTDLGIAPHRLRVVGEAPAAVFERVPSATAQSTVTAIGDRLGIDRLGERRLVVWHGAIAPHKNLPRLIDAFGAATENADLANACLVIVGEPLRDAERVRLALATHATHHAPGRVLFTGRLGDETLRDVLCVARLAVLPSLEEGYGLSAVEAAACGTPVVATHRSAIPDVLGDAALLVDPADTAALADAMSLLLRDDGLCSRLRERSGTRMQALTWEHAARTLKAVLLEAAGR